MAIRKNQSGLTGYQRYTKEKLQTALTKKAVTDGLSEKEKAAMARIRWEQQHDQVMGTDDFDTRNAPDYTKNKSDPKKDKEFLENMRKIGEGYMKRSMPGRKK